MRNYKFSPSGFLKSLFIALLMFAVGASFGHEILGIAGAAGAIGLPLLKPVIGGWGSSAGLTMTMNGINVEVWEKHIEENLFPSNEFMAYMMDESEYVNNLTVHNPQAGAAPGVTKNRAKGGARTNTNLRTDTVNDWSIDEYTTDPFLITNAEEVQLSYNKRDSVLYETQMVLRQTIGDNMIIAISPTGAATLPANLGGGTNNNILRTTGQLNNDPANAIGAAAYTSAATGNRLTFTVADVKAARKLLNKQNVPKEDRVMLMSTDAVDQLINDMIATKYRASLGDIFDTKTGIVEKLLGFTIVERSYTCVYNNTNTPVVKAYGAAGAADDNDAAIFWQKAFVAKAIGDIHVYETLNSAVDYGDVYSALVRMGANKRRSSEIGLGAIVQAAAA